MTQVSAEFQVLSNSLFLCPKYWLHPKSGSPYGHQMTVSTNILLVYIQWDRRGILVLPCSLTEPTSVKCPNRPIIPWRSPHTSWSSKSGSMEPGLQHTPGSIREQGISDNRFCNSGILSRVQQLQKELSHMKYIKNIYIKHIKNLAQVLKRSRDLSGKEGS